MTSDRHTTRSGSAAGGAVSWRIVPLDDRNGWSEALEDVPHAVAHTWAYNVAMQDTSKAWTGLFVCSSQRDRYVCPIAVRDHQGHTDIYTPSGFAGPVGTGPVTSFREAWASFVAACEAVASYLALHPRLAPDALTTDTAASSHGSAYVMDLDRPIEAVWRGMSENRRRTLRRFRAEGGAPELDRATLAPALTRLYGPFMRQRGASAAYALTDTTLLGLCAMEEVLVVGYPQHDPEAVALFGATAYGAEYLYGVATPEARQYLLGLIWHAVERFVEQGVPWLNLGGGVKPSLAEFKRRFGAQRLPIIALKGIHQSDVYASLCRSSGVSPDADGYFPAYRSG